MTEEALDTIAPFLDVYRVDIKGFSEKTYQRICHMKDYRKILETTKRAKEYGMHVEAVTNIIPGFNDDENELRSIAPWIKNTLGPDIPWHVTRFYPHYELSHALNVYDMLYREIANKRIELLELAIVILILLEIVIFFFRK